MGIENVDRCETYEKMSLYCAAMLVDRIKHVLEEKKNCVFVPSAGRTPIRSYEILQNKYIHALDWNRVIVVQMDEYFGLPCDHPKSFAAFLHKNLVGPLQIETFITFFDLSGELVRPLSTIDGWLRLQGGIDIVLYGIGENGHIGFNEPPSSQNTATRTVKLAHSTLEANSFTNSQSTNQPSHGVTLGLKTLLASKHSILIANGTRKRSAINKTIGGPCSAHTPASYLQRSSDVHVIATYDCLTEIEHIYGPE